IEERAEFEILNIRENPHSSVSSLVNAENVRECPSRIRYWTCRARRSRPRGSRKYLFRSPPPQQISSRDRSRSMTDPIESNPLLPPELEQIIFTYAVEIQTGQVTNLSLVAKRVREWLIPVVYKMVIITLSRSFPTKNYFTLDQYKKYGPHIRYLGISCMAIKTLDPNYLQDANGSVSALIASYLQCCPNLVDFALWGTSVSTGTLEALSKAPLKYLTINMSSIIHLLGVPNAQPLFPDVTHLDLRGESIAVVQFLPIHFPNLTHLALKESLASQDTIKGMFERDSTRLPSRRLQILVLGFSSRLRLAYDEGFPTEKLGGLAEEHRRIIVHAFRDRIEDWETRIRGEAGQGLDIWAYAEKAIAERKLI
ncbi:hypothetical protein BDN72DRAFT_392100, partial [Pluteus cervinus]